MISFKTVVSGAKVVKKFCVRYAPQILTGLGIASMAGATVHAIKTAPKAKKAIDEIEADDSISHREAAKKKTLAYAKFYWPELLMTFGGAGLIIGGQHISLKRLSIAATALSMERDKLKKVEEKVAEKFGDKKLNEIHDEIARDDALKEAKRQNIGSLSGWYNTGHGTTKFYEPIGRRFFLSDIEYIHKAEKKFNSDRVNRAFNRDHSMKSINKWFESINLPPLEGHYDAKNGKQVSCSPNIGKDWGWKDRDMELSLTAMMLGENDTCFVLGYTEEGAPRYFQDIDDYDGDPIVKDDETDMRDRIPW